MSIVVKKKSKFKRKKLLQRIIILATVYTVSFCTLYFMFTEKTVEKQVHQEEHKIFYKNEGEKLLAENQYPKAVEYYLNKLDENEDDFVSMNKLGQAYFYLKHYEKAKFYLYKSFEISPSYIDNYIFSAYIYTDEGNLGAVQQIIATMPLSKKHDYVEKGKLLILLADKEDSKEDKIAHYANALVYFKEYDKELYKVNRDKLIELYFELAAFYIKSGHIKEAGNIYKYISQYKNDCETNIRLALAYQNISDDMIFKHVKNALNLCKTQEDRRLCKQNIINLKTYFDKKEDYRNARIMRDFLSIIDESLILIDENFSPFAVVNEEVKLVQHKNQIYPQVTFSVLNKSSNDKKSLYVKVEGYITPHRVLSNYEDKIIEKNAPLKSNEKTNEIKIKLKENFEFNNAEKYKINISLSENGKDWYLYRIYKNCERQYE